jgi:hypothetical protein
MILACMRIKKRSADWRVRLERLVARSARNRRSEELAKRGGGIEGFKYEGSTGGRKGCCQLLLEVFAILATYTRVPVV